MNKLLIAILNAIVILHQENKAIARELTGNEGIDKMWDELFFAQLKDVMAPPEEAAEAPAEEAPKRRGKKDADSDK